MTVCETGMEIVAANKICMVGNFVGSLWERWQEWDLRHTLLIQLI